MTGKGLKRLWLPLAVVAFAGIQVFGKPSLDRQFECRDCRQSGNRGDYKPG